ncbi:electron transport complex protein RnfA [Pseudodesulfovibrio piezophilus]|uniref:Ion-translocating oxidoreductase complex subunit A n=1 Tax=Pseudodesulfovibrio piezophilus (strain DSM 21447 / JCM 15486 / C1TLV30) TaxID=1322246 RepID=M1WQ14_PSEP2|nr:RnfABCDGE type electron transport complex subunit A [Pseudodesulfovibrio piezophilus]CCH47392.1 putative inner membrane subunit of an electron transport system [Pseudodesulfovibrio piezophilus C1TLV30]
MDYFVLIIAAIFVNNIVLAQYLGNCPFIGTSKESGVALGMGLAVIFVATLAAAITWCVQKYLLGPYDLGYLQTITFILVIAALVQFVEMFLKKVIPPLYKSLGIFLPLITTNCAVLGISIICQREGFTLIETILFSIASGIGFLLALVVLAGIRERLDLARVPVSLKGTPLALIMAGLMSLTFFAFKGMAS